MSYNLWYFIQDQSWGPIKETAITVPEAALRANAFQTFMTDDDLILKPLVHFQ